jgi:5'-methylthioadenosine phosphorylase
MEPLKVGVIGGSGLAAMVTGDGTRLDIPTPFGKPSDALIETTWDGVPVVLLSRHGPGHVLNPTKVPYRANIFALKQAGCTHVIATGAVGSLRDEFAPRALVVPDQIIDKTHRRENTFYDNAAVHVEMAEPFCGVLRQILIDAAGDAVVHKRGCYVAMEGPAFSTRAESLMHRLWGGDLIGMTAMPEAKLAREAELSYALVALVTDYDSWRPKPETKEPADPASLLKEIIGNLNAASTAAAQLIRRAVKLLAERPDLAMAAPSRKSLKLAVWSDRTFIDPAEIERLRPLWARVWPKP